MLVIGLGLLLIAGPWYAKNAVLTGNPVYPLVATWLDGTTRTPEKTRQWNRAHQTPRDAAGNSFSIGQWLEAKQRVGLTSEWLSPIAWPLAILGVCATYRRRETQVALAAVAWVFSVWFFATHRIDRFWLPAVPLLCLIAGAAWQWADHKLYRRILMGLTIAGLSAALLMIVAPIYVDGSRTIISSPFWLTSIERLRQEGPLPSHQWLNQQNEGTAAVLLVGDAIPFDLEMPAYYNTCFDDNVFELLTKDHSPDEIRKAFGERKIAHMLVDWAEIARYRSPGNYGFTDYVQPEVFRHLVEQQILEPPQQQDDDGRWEIYRVRQ